MLYKELQEMIEKHIYYKEISKGTEVIMRIWCNKDEYNKHYFTIKLGDDDGALMVL